MPRCTVDIHGKGIPLLRRPSMQSSIFGVTLGNLVIIPQSLVSLSLLYPPLLSGQDRARTDAAVTDLVASLTLEKISIFYQSFRQV